MFSAIKLVLLTSGTSVTSLVWFGFYKFLRIRYKFGEEFTSRIIASVHALVVTFFSMLCYLSGPDPFSDPGKGNTWLQEATLLVSLGYFAYDMAWCVIVGSEPAIMLAHHAASLAAMAVVVMSGRSGAQAVAGLGSLEVTNPLLQARWFLRAAGYNHTPVHSIVEVLFFILFFLMRVVFGTKLLATVMLSADFGLVIQISSVGLYAISIIFMYVISRFMFRKYVLGIKTACCDFTCSNNEHIPHVPDRLHLLTKDS